MWRWFLAVPIGLVLLMFYPDTVGGVLSSLLLAILLKGGGK